MLDVGAAKRPGFCPPVAGWQVKIRGLDQITDTTTLVGFLDASPEAIEFLFKLVGFVEQDRSARNEIEDVAVGACDRRIELPAGKNIHASSTDRGFYDFLRAFDTPAAEPRVNGAEQMFAEGSLSERQQQRLVHRIG